MAKKPHPGIKNLIPVKPGEVRNPKGRLPGKTTKGLIKSLLNMPMTKNNFDGQFGGTKEQYDVLCLEYGRAPTYRELMIGAIFKRAMKGDVNAFNALCDREYGKPKIEIEHSQKGYLDYLDDMNGPEDSDDIGTEEEA